MNIKLLAAALLMGAAFSSPAQGPWDRNDERGPMGPPRGRPGMDQWQGPRQWAQDDERPMGPPREAQDWGRREGRRMGPPEQDFRRGPMQQGPQQFRGGPQEWGGRGDPREMMRERMRKRFQQQGPQRGPQGWGRGKSQQQTPQLQ